jgi:hypothetical protein
MSPRKIISQELIDWASDDELVEGEDVVSYTQLPIELDSKDDSLQQPTNITNEPTNQMEVVQKLFVTNGKNGVCHRDFMDNYIARFGALIWTLRHEQNWVIDKEWCEDESHHHKSNQYKYIFKGVDNATY